MKTHRQKMIAPIVVTAILVVYYAVYFALLMGVVDGVMIVRVCVERIHEIQGGEEDDLGQY